MFISVLFNTADCYFCQSDDELVVDFSPCGGKNAELLFCYNHIMVFVNRLLFLCCNSFMFHAFVIFLHSLFLIVMFQGKKFTISLLWSELLLDFLNSVVFD